jgi:NodT family efflux transporter outer membrane factor (OMF) lipoprotein
MACCPPIKPPYSRVPKRFMVGSFALSLLSLTSSGCTSFSQWVDNGFKVGPNYQQPLAPVASEWIDSKSPEVKAGAEVPTTWWTVFHDPKLNTLIENAYRQNLTLKSAGTRILAARAERDIAVGNLFPQRQQAFGASTNNALSGTTAFPPIERFFENRNLGVGLNWEIDFWGRYRRSIEVADAELDASVEQYDDALVILISEVASAYVDIRVYQQRLKFVEENIAIQTQFVDQAEKRLKGGVGRKIDQGQQRSNLTDTMALKEQLEIGLRLANNRLCILLGIPVKNLLPELGDGDIPTAPPEVAVGMPSDLLRRRPDLRRAERLVAAQSARIGVATANLYPHISLLGSIGYEAENFSDLFSSRSFTGSVGPNFRWDILNYGRLVNAINVQDARFQTAAYDYQDAVLRAGREVEDSLVLFLRSQKQTRQLIESAKEAKIAAVEASTLSKDVKFDLNQAFVTSNFLVGQQDKLAQAQGDIAKGLIQIYKAMGGGWEIRLSDSTEYPHPQLHPHHQSQPHAVPWVLPQPQAKLPVPPQPTPQPQVIPVSGLLSIPRDKVPSKETTFAQPDQSKGATTSEVVGEPPIQPPVPFAETLAPVSAPDKQEK